MRLLQGSRTESGILKTQTNTIGFRGFHPSCMLVIYSSLDRCHFYLAFSLLVGNKGPSLHFPVSQDAVSPQGSRIRQSLVQSSAATLTHSVDWTTTFNLPPLYFYYLKDGDHLFGLYGSLQRLNRATYAIPEKNVTV